MSQTPERNRMDLHTKSISAKMDGYSHIKDVYDHAFPRRERLPMVVLLQMARRKNVCFLAFYDKDIFCGFTYLITHGNTTLVFYLAVDDTLRSKGYGKQILHWIAENTTSTIVLDIEATEKEGEVENYEQRVRRMQFYTQNGYKDAGITMRQYGELYDVLYYGESFSEQELKDLLKEFSFGFSQLIFKIEKKG